MALQDRAPPARPGRFATLTEFVATWTGKTRDDFLAKIPCPILVEIASSSDVGTPTRLATIVTARTEVCRTSNAHVFFLEKKNEQDAMVEVVTVGRAPSNDLVLPYPDVSKLHAFFRPADQGWVLVDASSTNGTEVDGLAVPAATPLLLRPDRAPVGIRFGPILCELLSPAEFWARSVIAS